TYTVSYFFFSSRRRHTRFSRDWSSDVCSSDLGASKQNSRIRALPLLPLGRGAGGEGPGLSDCSETTYGPESSRPLPNPLPSWERSEERRVGKEGRSRRCRTDAKEEPRVSHCTA